MLFAIRAVAVGVLLSTAVQAQAGETYYIGAFAGAKPADDPHCGNGKGAHPDPHPCATLAYWNEKRRSILTAGDVVRFAPATYHSFLPSRFHCILMQRGVTYEGRNAADDGPAASGEVDIDIAQVPKTNDCFGRGVTCPSARGCDASGFTLRDVTLRNGAKEGVKVEAPDGVTMEHLLFERVRTINFSEQGFNVSNQPSDVDCETTGRRVRDIVIRECLSDSNHGVFGGIVLNCVDGFVVEDNTVRNNLPLTCTWEQCASGSCDCNDHDGIQLGGAINGVVRRNEVRRCGEDCLDVGGHWLKTYNVTLERNWVADGGARWVKVSGRAHDVVFRNNVFTGRGVFEIGTCEERIALYNNTMWRTEPGPLLKLWTRCHDCSIVNNLLRGVAGDANGRIVIVSRGNAAPDLRWSNNLIYNASTTGWAVREEQGAGGCGSCDCGGRCPVPAWCPNPWPAPQRNPRLRTSQLETFRRDGAGGAWFGSGSGDGDVWGREPLVVGTPERTPQALRLREDDEAARGAGADLRKVGRCMGGVCSTGAPGLACAGDADCAPIADFTGMTRSGSWDIGAFQSPARETSEDGAVRAACPLFGR